MACDDGQRIAHQLATSAPRARRGRRASRGRAACARARSRAPRRRRSPGSCETRVALQQRDRVGDRLLRADARRAPGTSPVRAATSSPAVGGRAGVVEHAVDEHPVVVEDLREVRRGRRRAGSRAPSCRAAAPARRAARRAAPCRPRRRSGCPRARASRRVAANASRSETRIQRSTMSRSNVVGQKSSPTPSTR